MKGLGLMHSFARGIQTVVIASQEKAAIPAAREQAPHESLTLCRDEFTAQ